MKHLFAPLEPPLHMLVYGETVLYSKNPFVFNGQHSKPVEKITLIEIGNNQNLQSVFKKEEKK